MLCLRYNGMFTKVLLASATVIAASIFAGAQLQISNEPLQPSAVHSITAQYLYASGVSHDGTKGIIAGYRVQSDGTLTSTGQTVDVSLRPTLLPSRLGAKLFGVGFHRIWVFAVNPTSGRLKFISITRLPRNVLILAFGVNPDSTLLFVGKAIDFGKPTEVRLITTYRISPSGTLTPVSSFSVPLLDRGFLGEARTMVMSPGGQYVYVNTRGSNLEINITQLRVNSTAGTLSLARNVSLGQVDAVTDLVRSPSGRYLYQGFNQPLVNVFSVDATSGAIKKIQEVVCECDGGPDFAGIVAVDPLGRFLFQATGQIDGIAVYSRNTTSGVLTPLTDAFFAIVENVEPIFAVDASGKFLFLSTTRMLTNRIGSEGALTNEGPGAALPADMRSNPDIKVLAIRK